MWQARNGLPRCRSTLATNFMEGSGVSAIHWDWLLRDYVTDSRLVVPAIARVAQVRRTEIWRPTFPVASLAELQLNDGNNSCAAVDQPNIHTSWRQPELPVTSNPGENSHWSVEMPDLVASFALFRINIYRRAGPPHLWVSTCIPRARLREGNWVLKDHT